jgi:hypothetical protein
MKFHGGVCNVLAFPALRRTTHWEQLSNRGKGKEPNEVGIKAKPLHLEGILIIWQLGTRCKLGDFSQFVTNFSMTFGMKNESIIGTFVTLFNRFKLP